MVINIFNSKKIILINKAKLIIFDYKKLSELNKDLIKIDEFIITGQNLKIFKMDDDQIEINGEIKEIKIE